MRIHFYLNICTFSLVILLHDVEHLVINLGKRNESLIAIRDSSLLYQFRRVDPPKKVDVIEIVQRHFDELFRTLQRKICVELLDVLVASKPIILRVEQCHRSCDILKRIQRWHGLPISLHVLLSSIIKVLKVSTLMDFLRVMNNGFCRCS
jgi:hypothetical protein